MAIAPIGKRLDQMTGTEDFATNTELVADPLPPPIDAPELVKPDVEPVQVAGGKLDVLGVFAKALKGASKESKAEVMPIERLGKPSGDLPEVKAAAGANEPPRANADELNAIAGTQPIKVIGDQVVAEPLSRQEIMRFVDIVQGSPTTGAPPKVRPNLNYIDSEDSLKKSLVGMVEFHKNYINEQRRAGRSFDTIAAEMLGISKEKALSMALTRKPGDRPFTDAESLAVRVATIDLAAATDEAVTAAIKSGTVEDMAKAGQLIQMQGYAEAAYLGNVADYGRGLAINRMVVAPDKARSEAMRQIIEQTGIKAPVDQTSAPGAETLADAVGIRAAPDNATVAPQLSDAEKLVDAMGGKDSVRLAMQMYKALPSNAHRQNFARRLLSLGRAGMDSAAEIYQSALVSGVQTHLFNFLGTPIHVSMMLSERYLAGMARGDTAAQSAVFHGLRSIPKYLNQALAAGYDAFKNEIPADVATKFDQSRIATKAENFGVVPDTMLGKTIDAIGVGTRMFGFRVLTTVDETYKALLRGMEMEMIAAEASGKAFNSALDSGKSIEDATNVARDVYMRTIDADSTFTQAAEFARIATFQDDLPGAALAQAQKFFAHPLAKLMGFPFFKTPAQISLRIQERTPLATLMPRFWKAVVNPSTEQERSVALAKVGLSSSIGLSIMAADYISGSGVVINGYGPTNPKERENWLQSNQPYAIGIKNPDGSRTWIDYGRYDPVSGVIAMWADVRDTVLKLDDPDVQENLMLDTSLATVNYMLENQPMVQFFAELASVIRPQSEEEKADSAAQAERIIGMFQKQMAGASLVIGQSVVTGGMAPSGFVANIERYIDPFKRSTIPENQYDYFDIPGFRMSMRPVYEAIQQHRSRLPYFSNKMFVDRNDWYEPIKQGFGDLTTFLPTKIQEKSKSAINVEFENLRSGLPRISPTMGESMIKLNDQQMDRYRELVNYPFRSAYALQMLAGIDPDTERSMTAAQRKAEVDNLMQSLPSRADALISVINSPEYKMTIDGETFMERPTTKGERIKMLTDHNARYTQIAKRLMLAEFPELQKLIDQRKAYENLEGRKPPSLPLSPGAEARIAPQ